MSATTLDRRDGVDLAAAALMLLLTFSWGLNGVAAKVSNQGFSPLFVSVARASIAALLVSLWCRWRGIALFSRDGTLVSGILCGVLFGAEFLLLFFGLAYTSVPRCFLRVV